MGKARRWLLGFGLAGVAGVAIAGLVVALLAVRDARPVLVTAIVPPEYAGWVVVAWECPGGSALRDHFVGGRRYELVTSDAGAVCLRDAVPSDGYHLNYRHPAPPKEFDRTPLYRVDPIEVFPDTARGPTVDARVGAASGVRYDIAWVDLRPRPAPDVDVFTAADAHLGDQCDLVAYLARTFAEPLVDVPCGWVPTRPDAGLSGRRG